MKLRVSLALATAVVAITGTVAPQLSPPRDSLGLPFAFVENRGQWHPDARFWTSVGSLEAWVLADGWRLVRRGATRESRCVLEMRFAGTHIGVGPRGRLPRPGARHFLRGSDPEAWVGGARAFAQLHFEGVYPGIDVVLREQDGHLEYDLLLQPGADVSAVEIRCAGATGLRLAAGGALEIDTPLGPLVQNPPTTWSTATDGNRHRVPCRYVPRNRSGFGFAVEGWNRTEPLVVDPGLVWSTYLGGGDRDEVRALDVAPDGRTAIAGWTLSSDLPSTSGAVQQSYVGTGPSGTGTGDAFVAVLSADGTQLQFVTYLGGGGGDEAQAVDIDGNGTVTVAGQTRSTDFPTTPDAHRTAASARDTDVFVARLDPTGSTLLYSTYFGGRSFGGASGGDETLSGLFVDETNGWIYLNGTTSSTVRRHLFPVTAGALQLEASSGSVFLSILDPVSVPGTTILQYSTFLGGTRFVVDAGPLHVSGAGIVTLAGTTEALDHPTTPGAFQPTRQGASCGFVTRIDPSAAGAGGLVYSTYLGGSSAESDLRAATDSTGVITVAGTTRSTNFPTTATAFQPAFQNGNFDGIVARLDPAQSGSAQLVWASYLGGASGVGEDSIHALAIADGGIAVVGGATSSRSFPTTQGSFQRAREKGGGNTYGFVARFDTSRAGAASLAYSTALESCGGASDSVRAIHYDHDTRLATVAGLAHDKFVVSPGAPQAGFAGGNSDGFVARLELTAIPPSTTVYGTPCPGTRGLSTLTPELDAQLCNRYQIRFGNLAPSQPGVVFVGGSNALWFTVPLPIDLLFLGMPGCALLVSPDVAIATVTDSAGNRGFGFGVPSVPQLVGLHFYTQGLFVDPGANPLGVVSTAGADATVRW